MEKSTVSTSNEQVAAAEQGTEGDANANTNNVSLYLSIIALIAGLLSLVISLKKKAK